MKYGSNRILLMMGLCNIARPYEIPRQHSAGETFLYSKSRLHFSIRIFFKCLQLCTENLKQDLIPYWLECQEFKTYHCYSIFL